MYALFKDGKPYSEGFEDLSDLWLMYADSETANFTKESAILKEGYTIEEVKN